MLSRRGVSRSDRRVVHRIHGDTVAVSVGRPCSVGYREPECILAIEVRVGRIGEGAIGVDRDRAVRRRTGRRIGDNVAGVGVAEARQDGTEGDVFVRRAGTRGRGRRIIAAGDAERERGAGGPGIKPGAHADDEVVRSSLARGKRVRRGACVIQRVGQRVGRSVERSETVRAVFAQQASAEIGPIRHFEIAVVKIRTLSLNCQAGRRTSRYSRTAFDNGVDRRRRDLKQWLHDIVRVCEVQLGDIMEGIGSVRRSWTEIFYCCGLRVDLGYRIV